MPRRPLIESEPLRSAVVSAVLIGLLLASLALAQLYTRFHRGRPPGPHQRAAPRPNTTVGDLRLWVPGGWAPADEARLPGFEVGAIFVESQGRDRELRVTRLPSTALRPAPVALVESLRLMAGDTIRDDTQPLESVPFGLGAWSGWRYMAATAGQGPQQAYHVAVMTQDARHYWLLYLSARGSGALSQRSIERLAEEHVLLDRICGSVADRSLRPATRADWSTAGLAAPDLDELGLTALVAQDALPGQPIRLMPADASHFACLRVLATPDAGVDDPADPLSPAAFLRQRLAQALGRAAQQDEFWSGTLAKQPAWRATLLPPEGPLREQALARQLWYVRLAPGRGLVLEIVAPAAALEKLASLAPRIVERARRRAPGPAEDWDTMRQRGNALAQTVRQTYVQHLPLLRYRLLHRDGLPFGGEVQQVRLAGQPPQVRGQLRQFWSGLKQDLMLSAAWEAAPELSHFALTLRVTLYRERRAAQATAEERLVLQDATLQGARRGEEGQSEQWSAPVPAAFVAPIAEDVWPVESMKEWTQAPALIWLSSGRAPPTPHVARLVAYGPESAAPAPASGPRQPQWLLLLRPLYDLDTDQLVLDTGGQVLANKTYLRSSGIAGPSVLRAHGVERSQLLEIYPELEPTVRLWERQTDHE